MKNLLLFLAIIFSTNAFAIEFKGKFLQGHYIVGITDSSSKILIDKKEIFLKDLPSFFKKGNSNGLCKVVRY